jgi:hypothetical protein
VTSLPRPEDGCENCITAERSVIARPYIVRPDGPEGIRAHYRCGNCGYQWQTGWNLQLLEAEQPESDDAA